MLLKTNNLKFTINLKHVLALFLAFVTVNTAYAQEIIKDEVKEVTKKVDSVDTSKARKVDGVAAVVGDFIVLESDIQKERDKVQASGGSLEGVDD